MDSTIRFLSFVALLVAVATGCGDAKGPADGRKVVRFGHFPNVTHAQGLVAHGRSRAGAGWFEERLGPGASVEWYVYPSGPEAIGAMLAGALDATYVGPSPALNAYVKSKGDEIRVVAGSARGGAALVVQGDGRIASAKDFKGRTVATPQIGNTQDVACRAWLTAQGFKVTQTGGDVKVQPTPNPEQLSLFVKGDLDAVWTVEPWVSRLEKDAKGKVFLEEKDAVTTVLVVSAKFLREQPDVVRSLVKAHEELTAWVVANPKDAQAQVSAEIKAETNKEMPAELLASSWPRLSFETAISADAFTKFVADAQAAGFLKDAGDLSRFVETAR